MDRLPRWLRTALLALLALNALDLTTSLLPADIDRVRPVPARSLPALGLQLALLVPLALWLAPRARPFARWVRSLPIPRPALYVLATVFAVQLAHVALRREHFPFSAVAMFSTAVPDEVPAVQAEPEYLYLRDGRVEELNFMREGNTLFARFFEWDYKAAWVMRMYGFARREAYGLVATRLAAERISPPRVINVGYSTSTGRLVVQPRRAP